MKVLMQWFCKLFAILIMSSSSPSRRASSSPGSSIGDHEHSTPPPITIPPEIRIFQKENGSKEKESLNNNEHNTDIHQIPSLNNKKSFCIDALLAKSQSDLENIKRTQNHFVNNNYKDNVISRDLNSSPDDNLSR